MGAVAHFIAHALLASLTNWSMPCWGVRLCLSPSVCLHVHLCVCLSVCLCVHAIRQSVCLSVCTVCQPVCLSVCPSVCTHCTVCQSVCLSGFTLQVANRQCTPHSTVQYPTNSQFKYIICSGPYFTAWNGTFLTCSANLRVVHDIQHVCEQTLVGTTLYFRRGRGRQYIHTFGELPVSQWRL